MTPVETPPQNLIDKTVRIVAPQATSASTSYGPEPVVKFRIQSLAAAWLRESINRVETLTTLRAGWDSYDGLPVSAEAAIQAVSFLVSNAHAELARPAIVPQADGGVQIEWHRGGLDLEISFGGTDPGVFFDDLVEGHDEDGPVESAATYLVRYQSRLSE